MLTPLFQGKTPMRVAALMSGSGSNLEKILEKQGSYKVVCVITDKPESKAKQIATKNGIPYEENDILKFYKALGKPIGDLTLRPDFDRLTLLKLARHKPDLLAYCGYMSIASPALVCAYIGINVHPADLGVTTPQGARKFVGPHAVRDAIENGEKTLRSTTHIVENTVDGGRILMRSEPISVIIRKGFNLKNPENLQMAVRENQQRLKEKGDWLVFPKTLDAIAEKRFAKDMEGRIYFNGTPVPTGISLSEYENHF